MKTKELIALASRYGYKIDKSAVWMKIGKNDYDDLSGVELTGSHYLVCDSLPPKLAHAIIDYADTPVSDREDEKYWNLIIAQDVDSSLLTVWFKTIDGRFETSSVVAAKTLCGPQYSFSDKDIDKLTEQLASVPYGSEYIKIAEMGKREVKS